MADIDDWLARSRARDQRLKQYSERLAEYLVPALRFLGVEFVSVEFDGYGDDGQVHDAEFAPTPEAGVPEGIDSFAERACCFALPGAWEINAGSYGVWKIDVERGRAVLDHEWRDEDDFEDDEDEG
jgi:hypothetical protein